MAGRAWSLVIPAHNEAARLPRTVAALEAFVVAGGHDVEVILVDDGSSDGTGAVIDQAATRLPWVVSERLAVNAGKGAAIAAGVRRATRGAVVFCDADLAYPLQDALGLLALLEGGADVAVGVRDHRVVARGPRGEYSPLRRAATVAFGLLVRGVLGLPDADTQCGLKAFRREAAERLFDALTVRGFAFDVELLALARRWGLTIARLPVQMAPHHVDSHDSSVRVVRDGARMAADVLRLRARRGRGRRAAGAGRRR
jgi:glycosyltransferase involved in cell wall biosynthesis